MSTVKRKFKKFQKRKTSLHLTGVQLVSAVAALFFVLMILFFVFAFAASQVGG